MGQPPWVVTDFLFNIFDFNSEITVMYKGKRIRITMAATYLDSSPSIREQYLHYLKVADAYELDGLTVDDFYAWVLEACLPEFQKFTTKIISQPTLADYLSLETFHYEMHAIAGNLTLVRRHIIHDGYLPFGLRLSKDLYSAWPITAPDNVKIAVSTTEDVLSRTPRRVIVHEKEYFFKPLRPSDHQQCTRELKIYEAIEKAGLGSLRISRLFSVVCGGDGMVYGLLLRHINAGSLTLSCALRPNTPEDLRQRWANQITNILSHLHHTSIIWGDAKPENILIDSNNNAWVIDFGGGYTEGWVEKEFAETIQGDEQGLARIYEYLCQQSS